MKELLRKYYSYDFLLFEREYLLELNPIPFYEYFLLESDFIMWCVYELILNLTNL